MEKITGTLARKNSRGLVISQIQYTTPKIVEKMISVGLTSTGRGCELKLDMLEVVVNVAEIGKTYHYE